MKAYTATITKEEFVKELEAHQKADAFIRGAYERETSGGRFKGCAVGCSLESIGRVKGLKLRRDDHSLYETHLQIPEWLARIEDRLFEGMNLGKSKTWPVDFAKAINVGANLDQVKIPFTTMILKSCVDTLNGLTVDPKEKDVLAAIRQSKAAVEQMISALESRDGAAAEAKAEAAAWAAEAAAEAAESAPKTAARPARAAEAAARASARAAAEAGTASWAAAAAAAGAAEAAAWGAEAAAGTAKYDYFADELLKLLASTK